MQYDAVIFDLDGTLTDSGRGIVECTRYALQKAGRPVPSDDILQLFLGPPLADSFMRYCGMNEEEAARATDDYRERYLPIGWRENKVFAGIRPLLRALSERGVYLAVATGKPKHTSIDILRYYGLLQYFDKVAGPAPQDLHADKGELIRRVLPAGKHTVMVGDTAGDIIGARDAGIDSIAVLYGYGKNEDVLSAKPTYLVSDVQGLQTLLLGETVGERGFFISVEGLDGCGKTTQMKTLCGLLDDFGYAVHMTREPGGCPVAERIRDILLAQKENGLTDVAEAILFAASRAQHVHDVIRPCVQAGKAVISDRFLDSSVAYQGGGRQLGTEKVLKINEPAVDGCMPDVTVYLKIDHQTAMARRVHATQPDRIEQQNEAFFARVENAYEQMLARDAERFLVVDGRKTREQVAQEIRSQLPPMLLKRGVL